jgi:hypothetical protein
VGAFDEKHNVRVDVTDQKCAICVTVHTVEEGSDVDIDDVAIRENSVIWYPVADNFVDRGAERLRVAAVAERGRISTGGNDELVPDPVNLICSYPWADSFGHSIECAGCDPTRDTYPFNFVRTVDVTGKVFSRGNLANVFGSLNRGRDLALGGEDTGNEVTARILGHKLNFMSTEREQKYWYNLTSGQVEHGMLSPSVDRAGPYDTAEEAAHAMESIRANAEKWRDEEDSE